MDNILYYPKYIVSEYLNRWWVIILLIILVIYFVYLRKYYTHRESFNDVTYTKSNSKDKTKNETIDNEEKSISDDDKSSDNDENEETGADSSDSENDSDDSKYKKINKSKKTNTSRKDNNKIQKDNNKIQKDNNKIQKNNNKIQKDNKTSRTDNKTSRTDNTKTTNKKSKKITEGFTDQNTSNPDLTQTTSQSQSTQHSPQLVINTKLFNNLQLSPIQVDSCKSFYTKTITNILTNLKNLIEHQKKNEYLNIEKRYMKIITDSVDSIMNFLVNTIKTQYTLTRTSVKQDIYNILQFNITNQIDELNNKLINYMNTLAKLNSTTIDYNNNLKQINDIRSQIDSLMAVDKLLTKNGKLIGNSVAQINTMLNKSNILPIYEKNIDRFNQLLNSDFNGNEERLADKYSKMYTSYLSEEKKAELDINPLRLASQIESGAINILSNLFSSNESYPNTSKYNTVKSTDLVEQYGYTENNIKNPVTNIIPNNIPFPNNSGELNINNIYNDPGNRGNYLIDNKTRNSIIEDFQSGGDKDDEKSRGIFDKLTEGVSKLGININKSKSKKEKKEKYSNGDNSNIYDDVDNDINDDMKDNMKDDINDDINDDTNESDQNLLYGFAYYVFDVINDKMGFLWNMYKSKYGNSNEQFKMEENMIPLGFLMFVLSLFIYLIDLTS
jgi:hypothetical protein